jgi:hypothetical protein
MRILRRFLARVKNFAMGAAKPRIQHRIAIPSLAITIHADSLPEAGRLRPVCLTN